MKKFILAFIGVFLILSSTIPIKAEELNEKIILIDPGHGGDDPGASGNGIIEKDLNLKISNYMYDQFRKLGIPVKLTRTTDETVSPTERTQRILDAFGNNNDIIVISNHINSGGHT